MRTPIIVGNWKMNKAANEVLAFADQIKEEKISVNVESAICAPFVYLFLLKLKLRDSPIQIGAQNIHWEELGAYTGEVSAPMLSSIGVQYVIIGHSERRAYFFETNDTVNKKLHSALKSNLLPIVCVGETLQEREEGRALGTVELQVTEAFEGVSAENARKTVLAYEPVWAIGTGRSASSDDAQEMSIKIRQTIAKLYDLETADSIRIQYGGSVTSLNIHQFISQPDIDGALVGGASLDARSFLKMIQEVDKAVNKA